MITDQMTVTFYVLFKYIFVLTDEAPLFDQEFRRRTQHMHSGTSLDYRPRNRSSNASYNRVTSVPAITSSSQYVIFLLLSFSSV